MANTQAREGRCVSVTFRGLFPSEGVIQEVRERAALLCRARMVHAVILAAGKGFEARVEASSGQRANAVVARDADVVGAVAKAFDRLMVAELGMASPAPHLPPSLPALATRARLVSLADDVAYKQGSC
jgi:hypothetical protein